MRALAGLTLGLALAGCGGDDTDNRFVSCAQEKDIDVYMPGLEKAGTAGLVKVRLIESTPTPPNRGDNDMVVEVLDASAQPLDSATVGLELFMPMHGHSSSKRATVTALGQGRYRMTPVYLFMAGTWQVDVTAALADGRRDQARFRLCVD